MKKTPRKNPQDATLRNIRALKTRVTKTEHALVKLAARIDELSVQSWIRTR